MKPLLASNGLRSTTLEDSSNRTPPKVLAPTIAAKVTAPILSTAQLKKKRMSEPIPAMAAKLFAPAAKTATAPSEFALNLSEFPLIGW